MGTRYPLPPERCLGRVPLLSFVQFLHSGVAASPNTPPPKYATDEKCPFKMLICRTDETAENKNDNFVHCQQSRDFVGLLVNMFACHTLDFVWSKLDVDLFFRTQSYPTQIFGLNPTQPTEVLPDPSKPIIDTQQLKHYVVIGTTNHTLSI